MKNRAENHQMTPTRELLREELNRNVSWSEDIDGIIGYQVQLLIGAIEDILPLTAAQLLELLSYLETYATLELFAAKRVPLDNIETTSTRASEEAKNGQKKTA